MANPWFRLYSEFADDPKVQMMSEDMQRRLVMLMCSRCKDETLHETQRAFHWRISDAELADTKKVFLQNGFIDEDWELLNWNRRQFISDSSTERVRRSRQKKKRNETLQDEPTSEQIISDETGWNVTVTAPEQNRTDSDTEQTQRQSIRALATADALALSQAVNPEAHEDLSEWVLRIAVAHPRARMNNLGPTEIRMQAQTAITDAIFLEAATQGTTAEESARGLLAIVESLADVVPREQWQFIKDVPAYFAAFDYRRDPETFKRARGGASNGKRRGTEGNDAALQQFLAEQRARVGDHDLPAPSVGGLREDLDGGDVPALRGGADRPEAIGDRPGVRSSNGGVQGVLPQPSYPPRVQWPTRVR